ncbi:HNH endonuclease [Staphylococcus cohnii]|uniref:HNH endonuclease n=1 Tax=Staphylococcus cohnii TaxID=29382 RepID=UPI003CE68A34
MSKKLTIEEVKKRVIDYNSKLIIIDDKYDNNSSPLLVKCKECGRKFESCWIGIKAGKGCAKCSKRMKLRIEDVKKKIKNISPNIEILSESYKNNKTPLTCRCKKCNHIWEAKWVDLRTKNHGCRNCAFENQSKRFVGENNPNYNSNLSKEDRVRIRFKNKDENFKKWRKEVFEKDNYKCVVCSTKKSPFNAHHLNGYHWFEEGRFDVNNGVTLCETCHKKFHKIYSRHYNTKEQFKEYLKHAQ